MRYFDNVTPQQKTQFSTYYVSIIEKSISITAIKECDINASTPFSLSLFPVIQLHYLVLGQVRSLYIGGDPTRPIN